ncbi:MAG: beta-propeller fold lactonase family protein, partial [Marinicella sp.]
MSSYAKQGRKFGWVLLFISQALWAVDLDLSLDSNPTEFEPGSTETGTYQMTISKPNGTSDVTSIIVTSSFTGSADSVSSLTWSCSAAGASSCDSAGTTVNNNTSFTTEFDLSGDGNDVTIQITSVTYNSDIFNDLTFTTEITDLGDVGASNNSDSDTGNNMASANLGRDSVTDISISVSDSQATYTPGSSASYTITVANAGPSDAAGINVTDGTPPSDLNITSWSCTPTISCSPNTGGSDVDVDLDLAASTQAEIVVIGSYDSAAVAASLEYAVEAAIEDVDATDPDGSPETASDIDTINPIANLSIAVDTANPLTTTYTPGTSETYEVIVTNAGPSDVSGVTVIDNNLSEFSSISWTCVASAGSSCVGGTGNLNTTVDLIQNGTATFSVDVTFDSAYDSGTTPDPLVYTVTATNPDGYNVDSPDSSKELFVDLESNLVMTLDDGAVTYVPGLSGTFTATLTNNGPSDVTGVTVVDSDLTEISSISWTCSVTDANSSCPAGPDTMPVDTTVDLAAGDSAIFTIDVNYLSGATTNPLIYQIIATNPIDVDGDSPAIGTDGDDDLNRQVDLTITKESKTGDFVPSEPFTYTIVVTNAGPSDLGAAEDGGTPAENVLTVLDTIDSTLAEHPSECNGGTSEPCWEYCPSDLGVPNSDISPDNCPGTSDIPLDNGYSMNVPMHLAAGSSSEIRIHARIADSTGSNCDSSLPDFATDRELCNTVTTILDETTTENVGTQNPLSAFVVNDIVVGTDLVVTKTDGLTAASPGTDISYEIVVRNDGFTDANGITVADMLPIYPTENAGFVTGSISWVCETNDANACCVTQSTSCGLNSPVMGSGDDLMATIDLGGQSEVKFTVTGSISNLASGTISNTATATLPVGIDETDNSNNSATDDDTVLGAESDVSVTKELLGATGNTSNDLITDLQYEIVVTNNGPSFADNIEVDDLLSDDEFDQSTATWTCSIQGSGNCDEVGPISNGVIDTTVDLAVGSTATFNLTVSTDPSPQGSVVNTVIVKASGFDPVAINDNDTVEYALSGTARLRIENDDALNTATPGLPTSYTVRVQNEGPDNVFGATVENLFPADLTDVEWTCSAISPIPGDLTLFQSSDQTINGTDIILSPDGSHVYIASPDVDGASPYESRLYVFERNTTPGADFGQITFVEYLIQGDSGIDGIEAIVEFQMSLDGAYLYALSTEPDDTIAAIATFSRNNNRLSPDFGRLTFLNAVTDQMPASVVDLLLSPDQKHVYVTGDDEIIRFARDTGTGLLSHEQTDANTVAGHMVISSDGSHMYVVDEISDQIDAYDRETDEGVGTFGDLTSLNSVTDADIDMVTDMVFSADDKSIYLAATGTDKLVVIDRDLSSGMISFAASYNDADFSFEAGETLVGMNQLSISPDGEHLFVSNPVPSDANDGNLLVLSRNSNGFLSKDQEISEEGTQGLNDVLVTHDGKQVLTTATDGKTLMAFDRRQPDPTFSFVEVEIDQQDDLADSAGIVDGLLGAAAVVVSDDGSHVYTASIGANSIAVFERDSTKGSTALTRGEHLLFIDSYQDGASGITGLADVNSLFITPNGEYLYAGSRDESTLAVFSRQMDGTLTFVTSYSHSTGVTDGLLGISDIVVDDNSQSLYVVGQFEASVAHYSINGSGELSLVGAIANGDVGVSGLGGARTVTLTPDGDHLIVGGGIDDSIVVLDRSLIDGQIVFKQHLAGVGDQPMDVAVSPDGEHIYVASANDSRLTVINRNNNAVSAEYGQVTINTSYIDNVGGFNELLGLRAVVVSPDGNKVYVGAEFDAAVSVLDRDSNPQSASFGRLAVVEVQKDDVDGVNGLNQLYDLAVSRDSRHVYAVGFGDNALAAFVLGIGSSCSTQGSGNILDVVDIGSNGTLTYSVTGTIRSDATGSIVTEARILPPNNFTVDLPLDNCANPGVYANDNCDQDSTTLVPITDLAISKSNGQLSAIAGQPTEYEIRVTNAGPSDARSNSSERVMVKDILVTNSASDQFEPGSISWTCEAVGSGSLTFLDAVINDVDGVQGMAGVSSVAYAENLAGLGPHVIATSVIDNGLLIFSVDILTGELTQVLPLITATPGISITGARDVMVIDDDIYVASQVDDSLVAFHAQDNSGSLEIQWVENHEFPTVSTGLNQAVYVTSSADGAHVYVAGANDDAVVVFGRDLGTGALLNTAVVNGLGQGLSGVNTLAVSSDGYSVYTSGFNDNEIGRYSRDLVTGDLTFIEVINSPGVVFDAVSSIEVSPDDNHVYITSAGNHRIYTFARDTSVATSSSDYGSLSIVQTVEQGEDGVSGLLMPSDILISEDGRHAYVSSEQSDAVVWFARNDSSGTLVFGGLISDLIASVDGLNGAIALAADSSGQYIYVAGSQDNGIAVLTRSSDSFCPAAGSGNLSELDGSIDAGIPVDLAVNGQLIFKVNATVAADATGTLTNEASVLSCELPLTDPVELCIGSDPNTTNNTAIDNDVLNPTADLMISKTDGVSEYEGLTGASQVTGDDQYLYVAASQDNAISIFKRESNSGDGEFGLLTYLGQRKNGLDGVSGLLGASDVLLSTDGQTLYAAGSGDNSVVVFNKESNGQLTFVEKLTSGVFGVTGIEGVSNLSVSSDGAHLYATGPLTNSLAVFEINQTGGVDHGKLTFIQHLQNAVDGVSGLANASDVLVSQDNMHVYVTSESGHSVSLFLRNPNDASVSYGQLSYQASYIDDIDGIGGMMGAKKMAIDINGEYLYVLGSVDQALVVFGRDDTTGELSFIEFKQNGTSGVVGLNLAHDLVISLDQQSLYVAGRGENALVRFNRDQIDGTLDFADVINDGDGLAQPGTFVDGLSGVAGLFMPSDDQHLYVVADQDHSITVFNRDVSSPAPDLGILTLNDVLINGRGGVAPGTELTYLIVASNAGPSDVEKARVVDIFPPEFQSISFECFPLLGAGCTTGVQSGNVDILVDLPVGSSIEILATGVLRPDASGVVTNTATIASSTVPEFAVSDPDLSNNTATDDDTVLFVASDLTLTKDNGVTESIPGAPVSYTITVSNDATLPNNNIPADVSGVVITDIVPEAISDVSWTCQAFPLPGLLDDGDGNGSTDNYISNTELDLYNDLIIHTNEELAYAVGESAGESVLLIYQRNSRSGELIEIQRVVSSDIGVNGLAGAQAIAISPDSRQLYVVSNIDDAITTWTIDANTGLVTYAGALIDGISGVNGLGGAVDVLVASDGLHIYVAGKADNAIAIFNRDIGSGLLNYNSFLTGVEGLSGINALVQAGEYIVVASETNQSVATFTRSIQNGLLVSADVLQDFEIPGSVLNQPKDVVFANNQILVASFGSDAISIFDLDPNDGLMNFSSVITQGDTGVTHLEGPESISVSSTGELMYVGSSVSEAIMLFIYNGVNYDVASTIYDTALIPDLDSVNQVVMSSGGTHLYALSDELVLTEIQNGSSCTQSGTGSLNDVANIVSMGYVEYTLNGTILPTATGILSNTASALMSGDAVELNPEDNIDTDEDTLVPTSDLSVTKDDGLIEVVAGTDLQYEISVFSAGPSAMDLMVEDLLPIYPTETAGFESQSAQWTCSTSRALQFNGLYEDNGLNGLAGGTHVTESPDGNFVYVISNLGTLSVFSKDTSGVLTLVQIVSESDDLPGGEVSGLVGAVASDMDSLGHNIYVISQTGNQVVVFSRNTLSGLVDYQQTLSSG